MSYCHTSESILEIYPKVHTIGEILTIPLPDTDESIPRVADTDQPRGIFDIFTFDDVGTGYIRRSEIFSSSSTGTLVPCAELSFLREDFFFLQHIFFFCVGHILDAISLIFQSVAENTFFATDEIRGKPDIGRIRNIPAIEYIIGLGDSPRGINIGSIG